MRRPSTLFLFALLATSVSTATLGAQAAKKPLTVEAIFAHGPLIGEPPQKEDLVWSPDGKHLTYMDSGELIDLDPATGKSHVLVSRAKMATLDKTADTEQDRDHRSRYHMASFLWSPDQRDLLFDSAGQLWLYDQQAGAGVRIGASEMGSGDDPKFSPNGEMVSFIHNHSLAVIRLREAGSPMVVVAPAPNPSTLNGEVDWVYEEELNTKSNYFWSPDSSRLAYLEMNEAAVPEYPLTDWIPTHATTEMQRYPQPGDPNPDVRLAVVGAGGGKTVWIKLPITAGRDYVPRFGWANAKTLWIETLARDQKRRDLYFADAATGDVAQTLEITDDKFIDDKYDVWVGEGSIVLLSWSDGYNHIYLYSYDASNPMSGPAKQKRQLSVGTFDVSEIYNVDFLRNAVDYASNAGNPLEQQLWEAGFDGQNKQLTQGAGFHEGLFSPFGGAFVDKHSSRMEPPQLQLCSAAGQCNVFWQTRALESYQIRAPEQIEVKAKDGTTLYATLLMPENAFSAASVPLILNPYGGPGEGSEAANQWSNGLLFDELLAQHGFAVLRADNRGLSSRGRAFEQAAYHNFGSVQLEDQLTVLDAALNQHQQLDPKRVGWWGWSWGGTFTLYAMTHSDRFRAGVAVAPVTDWRDYDSIYTERYMGLPSEFASGYRDFSVVNSAAQLKGRLLVVHGTGDDNVHIDNSVQFIQKLVDAGIPYDLQIYPRKTHSLNGPEVRTHLYNRILAHFERYLMPAAGAAQQEK
jgi:dipeptidyl-peptidase-4